MDATRPPLPRFAEDGWNSLNPEKVALAYSKDSQWRNRSEFVTGREAIVGFLTRKWQRELEYRLIKEPWRLPTIVSRFASPLALLTGPDGDVRLEDHLCRTQFVTDVSGERMPNLACSRGI